MSNIRPVALYVYSQGCAGFFVTLSMRFKMKREIYLTVAVVVLLSVAFFNRGGQTQVQDMPNMLDFRALSQMEETEEDFSTGMHFESSGIVVDSDSEVTMLLEAAGEEVDLDIAPGLGLTSFTLSGLSPSTTYYLYTDNYHNLDVVTTDANGSFTFTLDTSEAHSIWIQTHSSTFFINAVDGGGGDCGAIGGWDQGTLTCKLESDVTEAIQIDDSGITLDCDHHIISGTGGGRGILLRNGRTEITVRNCEVSGFERGIAQVRNGGGHTIIGNDVHGIISGRGRGIIIQRTILGSTIEKNYVHDMRGDAINLAGSSDNIVFDNRIENITPSFEGGTRSRGIVIGGPFRGSPGDRNRVEKNVISTSLEPALFRVFFPSGEFTTDFFSVTRTAAIRNFGGNGNEFIGNTVSGSYVGIHIASGSQNATLTGNTLLNNKFNLIIEISIAVEGGNTVTNRFLGYNIDATNTVDGKPILYLKNEVGTVIDSSSNAGMVYCIQCDGVTIKDLTVSNNGTGVGLVATTNSLVSNITAIDNHFGIQLINSDSNTVKENHIVKIDTKPKADQVGEIREYSGVFVANGNNNVIRENTIDIASRFSSGVRLLNAVDFDPDTETFTILFTNTLNLIKENLIRMDGFTGISFHIGNNNNKVTENTIMGPELHVVLSDSSNNEFRENLMINGGAIQLVGGFTTSPTDGNVFRDNVNIDGTEHFGFGFGFDGSLRVPIMEAGFTIDGATNTIINDNLIARMKGDGLLLQNAASTQVSQNDIFQNEGFQANSDPPIELSVDGEGNFWGRTEEPLFIPGVDSNSLDVVDSFPSDEPFVEVD